jgi:hypothetical protein
MIDGLSALLQNRGLIDLELRDSEHRLMMTRAHSFGVIVFKHSKPWRFIKISEFVDATEEVMRYAAAAKEFADLVPAHLDFIITANQWIHVTNAIEIATVSMQDFSISAEDKRVQTAVLQLFELSLRAGVPLSFADLHNTVVCSGLLEFFAHDSDLVSRMHNYYAQIGAADLVSRLAAAPQHGDFAKNNIGMTEKSAVFFDWEDFGRVQVPGLDLYLLLQSLRPEATHEAPLRITQLTPIHDFIASACKNLALRVDDFERLFPLYAMLVCFLRKSYGEGAKSRARTQLNHQLSLLGM